MWVGIWPGNSVWARLQRLASRADLAGRLAQVDGQVARALPEAQQRRRDAEGGAQVLQCLRPPVRQVHLRPQWRVCQCLPIAGALSQR